MNKSAIDLAPLLRDQRLGCVQWTVVGLCLAAMLIDGYDLFMIGLALPMIAGDFGVPPADLTAVVVAQSVGMALGTCIAGPISDRIGRKMPLIGSIVAFALLTALTTQVHDVATFTVVRFMSGVFFAGVIPNAVALTNEMTPARYRSGFVALIFCGYSGGASIGSLVNGYVLEIHGWQAAFWIGGAIAMLLIVPLLLFLPESLPFRLRRNPCDPRAADLVRRMLPELRPEAGTPLTIGGERPMRADRSLVLALFATRRRRLTLLLWLLFCLSFLCNTTLAAWSGTILSAGAGLSIATVGALIGLFAFAGILGTGTSGFIMGRFGPMRTLAGFYLLAAAAIAALAFTPYDGLSVFFLMAVAGYAFSGAQGALNAYSSEAYETFIRATGVGWAFGSGRLGAIIGPIIGGQLLGAGQGPRIFFLATAAPLLCIVLLVPATIAAQRRSQLPPRPAST